MTRHLLLVATLGFGTILACTDVDELAVGERASAVENACIAERLHFDNFDGVTACEKDNPEMASIALNAIVAAGGTCTAADRDNRCTSLQPVRDPDTAELIGTSIDCMTFRAKDVQMMTCCSDKFGGFDSDRCFTAPYSLAMY